MSGKRRQREYVLTVKVRVPDTVSAAYAARLVQRLVEAGQEDAARSPDDYDDHDKAAVAAMTVSVKPAEAKGGS